MVAVLDSGQQIMERVQNRLPRSQVLVMMIMDIQDQIGGWENIDQVEVVTGPGSFTGLRVGATVANAIGYALNVTVNGKSMETELNYS